MEVTSAIPRHKKIFGHPEPVRAVTARVLRATIGGSSSVTLHSLLWGALLFGLLIFSVPALKYQLQIQTAPLSPGDPLRSMNYYFMGPNHAQRLVALMSRLPENRCVLIFVRGTAGSIFHGVALGYLAWPRPIEMVFGDEKVVAERLPSVRPDVVAAVAFCNVESPPWFAPGVLCGPGVRLVCLGEAESPQ